MLFDLQSVSVQFQKNIPALKNVSLSINENYITILSGQTGAGKTTLLKLLYGDLKPTLGDIFFRGEPMKKFKGRKRKLLRQISGIMFQYPQLISHLTCYENVMLPLVLNKNSKDEAHRKCLETMAMLNISYLRTKYPNELSIGEKKMLSSARAFAHDPEIIVADEPSENLDEGSKALIFEMMHKALDRGASLIVTSNDSSLLKAFPDAARASLNEGRLIKKDTIVSFS